MISLSNFLLNELIDALKNISFFMYVYIYVYLHVYIHEYKHIAALLGGMYVCIQTHTHREKDRERENW